MITAIQLFHDLPIRCRPNAVLEQMGHIIDLPQATKLAISGQEECEADQPSSGLWRSERIRQTQPELEINLRLLCVDEILNVAQQ